MRKSLVLSVLVLLAACGKSGPAGSSNWIMLKGGAELVSEFYPPDVAQLYLLFVPDFDPAAGSPVGAGGGGGWTPRHGFTIGYSYYDASVTNLRASVAVDDDHRVLECGGRRFELAAGNVFVVHVGRDGRSMPVQVRPPLTRPLDPSASLAFIQRALPNDARVQALQLR
jgi:hypothetical protein